MADRIIIGQRSELALEERARAFRKNPTPAEAALWAELRTNQTGFHFRRQQVIEPFIVDFYCHEAALVIEVDGDVHDLRVEADRERSAYLEGLGLEIIRFRNEDVLTQMTSVVTSIYAACEHRTGKFSSTETILSQPMRRRRE